MNTQLTHAKFLYTNTCKYIHMYVHFFHSFILQKIFTETNHEMYLSPLSGFPKIENGYFTPN